MLPRQLAGVEVLVNGSPAPILYASASQINFQVPFEIAGTIETQLAVRFNGNIGNTIPLRVTATAPNLYNGSFHADGTAISSTNPAKAGETVILFATGQGIVSPAIGTGEIAAGTDYKPEASVRVQLASQDLIIHYAGLAPGTAGVMQLNVQLPPAIATGNWPVVLAIAGAASQEEVFIAVR